MKRSLLTTLLAAVVSAFAFTQYAQAVDLRLAHGSPRGHPNARHADWLAEKIAELTGGEVKVTVYGDQQLGGDRDMIQLAKTGTVELAYASSVNFPLTLNKVAFDALQLPGLIRDYDHLKRTYASDAANKLLDSLDDAGLKGLCFSEGGLRHFLSNKASIKSVDDFKGLKTRIVPIPLHKLIWENLSANPIGVPYGEVYTAMQTKVIEAVEFNVSSIHAFKMYENANYLTLTGHYYWPGLFFMNKAAYDALSPAHQKAVVSACRDQMPAFLDDAKSDETDTIEKLKKLGMTVTSFTDRDRLLELTKPVFEEWSKKDPLIGEYIAAAKAAE